MSITVMSQVYATRLGGSNLKAVALKLADYANDDGGSIFPSVGTVALHTELSESTARRCIQSLLEMGIIEIERMGGKGPGDTTHYRFCLTRLAGAPKLKDGCQPAQGCQPDTLAKGITVTVKGVKPSSKGVGLTPDTPIETPVTVSSSSARARELPTTECPDFSRKNRPTTLDDDWELPADWREATEAKHPHHADMIDVQASKFRKFNIDKLTATDDWQALWQRWFDLAVNKAPGTQKARAIRDWNPGDTVHNTEFSGKNFQKYVDDCIKRGVYKPKPSRAS